MPPVTGPTSGAIDPEIASRLSTPQAAEAVRRGNIDEILRVTGISKKDWEDYLKTQSVTLNRDYIQNYSNYAVEATYPAPQIESFPPETGAGKFTPQDHSAFMESMGRVMGKAQVSAGKVVGKSSTSGKAIVADPSLQAQIDAWNKETDDTLQSITDKALETQLQMDYDKQSQKIRDDFMTLIANAKDPETIILALTQYKMREAGLIMTQEGQRVYQTNMEQTRAADATSKLNVNDPSYYAQTQVASQKVASLNMTMQQDTSTMQTASQNVESALNFGHSVIEEYSKNQDTLMRNFSVKS